MDNENDFKAPFDTCFAEDAIRQAADRYLPPARMEIGIETIWSQGWDNGGRVANGFRVCLTRDLSRIEVDLDFGNIPFDEADAKKAFGMAMDNFGAAARSVVQSRKKLTIHATSAALIAIYKDKEGGTGWKKVRDYLSYPIRSRCGATITPRGWIQRENEDKLRWRSPDDFYEEFRLPGKRILIPEFMLGNIGRMTNDRLRLKRRIPDTILIARKNAPLHELVSIPGFDEVDAIITGHSARTEGTELSIRSPTIDMEDAFELMARVISSAAD